MAKPRDSEGDQAPLVERISSAMLHNAGLFLRKVAQDIADHRGEDDAPFDVDRATLVTVLTQLAVELASTAMVLKNEGFASVVREKDLPASDAEAESWWEAGKIRTRTFEELKSRAAKYLGDDDFWSIVDYLQRSRNKLVHFHAPLVEGDRFDLKYEATHVLIQIIATLRKTGDYDFAEGCQTFLGKKLFKRLLSFEPYRERIEARAREIENLPLKCPICSIRAYSPDGEACIGCGWVGELALLKCPRCRERSVIYDHLNLPLNPSLKAVCGNCEWSGRAHHCGECETDFLAEPRAGPECPWCIEC